MWRDGKIKHDGNYLRVRGEYSSPQPQAASCSELPPRARRIHAGRVGTNVRPGTTSACAENTAWNTSRIINNCELPPRARRIRHGCTPDNYQVGTTSACAENTFPLSTFLQICRNYLRVRGEYPSTISRTFWMTELPPRARRILLGGEVIQQIGGTTSACAENTICDIRRAEIVGNYLRVRGEYKTMELVICTEKELPPRARRIQTTALRHVFALGTTSACAENTPYGQQGKKHSGNYLRVRGEYVSENELTLQDLELPPRARRIPLEYMGIRV